MAALQRYRPRRLDRPDLAQAAVLIPIVPSDRGDDIVFTARHKGLRFQPGDISLPGGKAEPGECDLSACALREAEEEIGLATEAVEIVGQLDDVVVASRYVVTPFAGLVERGTQLRAASEEVAELVVAGARDFAIDSAWEVISFEHSGVHRQTYRVTAGAVSIWGATARIVRRVMEIGYEVKFEGGL